VNLISEINLGRCDTRLFGLLKVKKKTPIKLPSRQSAPNQATESHKKRDPLYTSPAARQPKHCDASCAFRRKRG